MSYPDRKRPQLRLVSDASKPQGPVLASLDITELRLNKRAILGPMSLCLRAGETIALTGPSGVGKTSLLRCLAGLETRYEGEVNRPDRLAMVFQEPVLMPWRTARDNLTIPLGISRQQAHAMMAEVGLEGRGGAYPGQLSLGQQRRLALARAFAGGPEVLLMDEPFVSLDPKLSDEMMSLFERLRSGRTVATLLVTHVEDEATRLADRVLRLSGHPAQLFDNKA